MKNKLMAAVCGAALLLSGCSVDVNSLVSSKPAESSPKQSVSSGGAESSVSHEKSTDSASSGGSESDTGTDSRSDTDTAAFDESKYLTMFVSGGSDIPLLADALYGSEEVGELKCGDRVSVVRRDVMEYTFVYSPTLERFGYIGSHFLADYLEETTVGKVYYVKPAQAKLYADAALTEELEDVSMNDMVTVIVMRTDGKWRVTDRQGRVGYIDKNLLSEKKVRQESSPKESRSSSEKTSRAAESKAESQPESKPESKQESRAESKQESKAASSRTVSGSYTGRGEPPEAYTEYVVDVDVGYLALRDVPSADQSELLGKLYYEDKLYVIDTTGSFWYVYSPSLGMYGYVTGDPDYLYPSEN